MLSWTVTNFKLQENIETLILQRGTGNTPSHCKFSSPPAANTYRATSIHQQAMPNTHPPAESSPSTCNTNLHLEQLCISPIAFRADRVLEVDLSSCPVAVRVGWRRNVARSLLGLECVEHRQMSGGECLDHLDAWLSSLWGKEGSIKSWAKKLMDTRASLLIAHCRAITNLHGKMPQWRTSYDNTPFLCQY